MPKQYPLSVLELSQTEFNDLATLKRGQVYKVGDEFYIGEHDGKGSALISGKRQPGGSLTLTPAAIAALQAVPSGAYISITGDKTLTDDSTHAGILAGTHILQGLSYICTAALTVSLPDSLTLTGATVIMPPGSGNLSADPTGTATANGASTTLTRTRANNWTGVAIVHLGSGAYGINGA